MIGRNVNVLVPRNIRSTHDDLIRHNRETGINKIVGTSREVCVERFDGTTFWANLSLSRIAVDGKIGYMALIRDISQEVDDREKIRLLSLVVRETDRGVAILDPEFRIIYVNRAFSDMFGFGAERVTGMACRSSSRAIRPISAFSTSCMRVRATPRASRSISAPAMPVAAISGFRRP